MAVAVDVAVSGRVAVPVAVPVVVPVAGLTKRFFNHPKRFLNQCLGLKGFSLVGRPSDGCPRRQFFCSSCKGSPSP